MGRLFGGIRQGAGIHDQMTGTPLQPTQPGASLAGHLVMPSSTYKQGGSVVSRHPRQRLRHLYAYGAQKRNNGLPMRATGAVESSKFQTWDAGMIFNADFNDGLFEGGYPRNMGLTTKVMGPADVSLQGGAQPTQNSRPQQRISVFTRRSFSGAPIKPAKPSAS